jgi:hypothetical protein
MTVDRVIYEDPQTLRRYAPVTLDELWAFRAADAAHLLVVYRGQWCLDVSRVERDLGR